MRGNPEAVNPEDLRRDMREDEYHLDGNVSGGLLREIFGREVTPEPATCGACGSTSPMGGLMVHRNAMGDVVRCPGCAAVLFVVARVAGGYVVTFDRLRSLRLPDGS